MATTAAPAPAGTYHSRTRSYGLTSSGSGSTRSSAPSAPDERLTPQGFPNRTHDYAGRQSGPVAPRGHGLPRQRRIQSQYPRDSTEKHVEYILVAGFDVDRGSVMEHQYPGPVGGDEHDTMLAELMLPDQAHVRAQDWTIFFLHKDAVDEEDEVRPKRRRRRHGRNGQAEHGAEQNGGHADEESSTDEDEDEDEDEEDMYDEPEETDGPPLVYVLNLVNTKQDNTVKRGAVVKAMAICTRHSFLHIYKPLLLLGLQKYFDNPSIETLASLYEAVNSMDLSLMPKMSMHEKSILQCSEAKDLFIEKFEAMIAQRIASQPADARDDSISPATFSKQSRFGLPRDTHDFESVVHYANVPVPVRIPTALSPETVGDFSLIKLITTFSQPHRNNPMPFDPRHPHLTTSGAMTHPIIVLLNALLTQKRVIFLGHNLPSSDVAEAVLGACALASGGLLRGFTRHAFPYTDLTKIDDLLQVPGFIAGVTNPAFAHHTEWWDILCDLSTGRIRISNKIEAASPTEGVAFFQAGGMGALAGMHAAHAAGGVDATGDQTFMAHVLTAVQERHGENAIRAKFRRWVLKFTRLAAAFEETVYGATPLHIHEPAPPPATAPATTRTDAAPDPTTPHALPADVLGHGYVWASPAAKHAELAANATRIEGWRSTRSYYTFIQDLAALYERRPVKEIDVQHVHDRLARLRLGADAAAHLLLALHAYIASDAAVTQLLAVLASGSGADVGATSSTAPAIVPNAAATAPADAVAADPLPTGLFCLATGLFHPRADVREAVAELLVRIREHDAGRHYWAGLGRFAKMAFARVWAVREARRAAEEAA